MIKSTYEKWEELSKKVQDDGEYLAEYYVSRNLKNKIYFSIEKNVKSMYIEFTPSALKNFSSPKLNGMEIAFATKPEIDKSKDYIKISNLDSKDEMFLSFVSCLTDKISVSKSEFYVLEDIMETIKEYKKYFSNSNFSLNEIEEQGLCAELLQLKYYIQKYDEKIIYNWLGPNKNKRDFVFDDKSVEVKSTIGQLNPSIMISNELQLDNTYPKEINLYLKIFILEKRDIGFDIVSLANEIIELISSFEIKKVFISKLLLSKVDLEKYNTKNKYSLENIKYYHIEDNFPKLTKNNINSSIFDVKYKILLNELKGFECDE